MSPRNESLEAQQFQVFTKSPKLASTEVETLLNGLCNSTSEEETRTRILQDKLFTRFPEIEPNDYLPRRKLLLQIFNILKSETLSQTTSAAIFLSAILVRKSSMRAQSIIDTGIFLKILDILSRRWKETAASLELKRAIYMFLAAFSSISSVECRMIVDKQVLDLIDNTIDKDDMLTNYACSYLLRFISHVPELRTSLPMSIAGYTYHLLVGVAMHTLESDAYYAVQTRVNAVILIRNMAAHSPEIKLELYRTDTLQHLVNIANNEECDVETLYHAYHAIAHILPMFSSEEETTLQFNKSRPQFSKLSRNIIANLNQRDKPVIKRASAYCLSHLLMKFPIHFGLIFQLESKGLFSITNNLRKYGLDNVDMKGIQCYLLIAVRNLALIDKPSKVKLDITKETYDILLRMLRNEKQGLQEKHHILSTFCNLTVDDKCSQMLGTTDLIETVYKCADEEFLKKDALKCLANLCVDEATCHQILKHCKVLFSHLFVGFLSDSQRQDIICIIHNLIIQFSAAMNFFFRVDGFMDEVVTAISSRDEITQTCALQLVQHYLKQGTPKMKQFLLNVDPGPPIVVQMHSELIGSRNKILATKCFQTIVQMTDKTHNDHFTYLRAKWQNDEKSPIRLKRIK